MKADRKKGYPVDGVFPIRDYMLDPAKWAMKRKSSRIFRQTPILKKTAGPTRTSPRSKKARAQPYPERNPATSNTNSGKSLLIPEALNVLKTPTKVKTPEYRCLQCRRPPGSRLCTIECYNEFREEHFEPARNKIEIRETGDQNLDLGVYVKPGQTINEDDWLGEYLGEILPGDTLEQLQSWYAFDLAEFPKDGLPKITIDAATHGNWTRFVNSSCNPNVQPLPEQIGKVRVVAFRALRDIQAGEQLQINYGREYFEGPGIQCCCDSQPHPHLPPPKQD